jgi:uncharacterized membrane protein (DUF485 family)
MLQPNVTTRADWNRIAASAGFRRLLAAKRRLILPAILFFLLYFFALPVLVGYFPDLMKRRVWGPVNLAYLFALSQFVMAWTLAAIYLRVAASFDEAAHHILSGENK